MWDSLEGKFTPDDSDPLCLLGQNCTLAGASYCLKSISLCPLAGEEAQESCGTEGGDGYTHPLGIIERN